MTICVPGNVGKRLRSKRTKRHYLLEFIDEGAGTAVIRSCDSPQDWWSDVPFSQVDDRCVLDS